MLETVLLRLPFRDAALSTVFCGLTLHVLFNKLEVEYLNLLLRLLVILPLIPASLLAVHYSSLLSALSVGYFASYATLVVSVLLYRLSPFHPLARHPGPLLAKLSKLWCVYHTHTGKLHITFRQLHEQYGPIVRIGPNELSICNVDAVQPILHGMPKGPMWDGRRDHTHEPYALIGIRDLPTHIQRRKVWNSALNTASVKAYEPILWTRLDQLVDIFESGAERAQGDGAEHNLTDLLSFFAYDYMGDIAFGGAFELMRDGDAHGVWKIMESGLRFHAYTGHIPWSLPFLSALFSFFPAASAPGKKLVDYAVKVATTRISRGSQRVKDMSFHLLNEGTQPSNPPPLGDYIRDAYFAIIAGSDTVATTMSCIFFHLLSDPKQFARLRNEIDTAFPRSEGQVPADNSTKLGEMPYLNAVINEALRMNPPVPTGLQRAPVAGSGGKVAGTTFIPEGTAVYVPPYVIQRDPRYFSPDPNRFWPDRWLDTDNVVCNESAFFPYSLGPMNCAGKALAQMELRAVVATLVQNFDISFQAEWDPVEWDKAFEDWLIFAKGVLPVIVRQRKE
ncbi:high nitrogen upregulated cytochrome P450 monooxygenase 2 [Mycena rebaudengoi]|nr:high nitrogen upregulated cytochrome P450 monooxygenase 2 [Mycena rebaudengoi]